MYIFIDIDGFACSGEGIEMNAQLKNEWYTLLYVTRQFLRSYTLMIFCTTMIYETFTFQKDL